MVHFDFSEDDATWVPLKLSGAAGSLWAEALELKNWLLQFGCASKELWEVVSDLYD